MNDQITMLGFSHVFIPFCHLHYVACHVKEYYVMSQPLWKKRKNYELFRIGFLTTFVAVAFCGGFASIPDLCDTQL